MRISDWSSDVCSSDLPLILAVFAVLVVAALMMFVVPKVVEQFDTMGQTLPLLTRIVMGLSQFLAGWRLALLLGIGVLAGLGWRALREETNRSAADGVILNTTMIGRLLRELQDRKTVVWGTSW